MHKELFNPIKTTETMPEVVFCRYAYDRSTPEMEMVEEVKKEFYNSHADVDEGHLDTVWHFVEKRLTKSSALTRFVLDSDGAKSDYFFPWLMSVKKSPSEALELAYNSGRNLRGEWVDKIPEDDEIGFFVKNMPTLAYNRECQLRVAELVMSDREDDAVSESKVIDLGAGRMAWARHHGFKFKPRLQQVIACDKDPAIEPEKLFSRPQEELKVVYRRRSLTDELRNLEDCQNASLMLLKEMSSYCPMDIFKKMAVEPAYARLRDGGRVFFDLRLEHVAHIWSMRVMRWPKMRLQKTVLEAIDSVERIRKDLWRQDLRFRAEYTPDTYSASPLSVMVLLTKI